jgi:signal transduction histidine kinase
MIFMKPLFIFMGISTGLAQSDFRVEPTSPDANLSSPTFRIVPNDLRVRHRLTGLDPDWIEEPEEMNFVIRFILSSGDEANRVTFPITGQSRGWSGDLATTPFTLREERVVIPPDVKQVQFSISSSGAPQAVGVYAIKGVHISVFENQKISPLFVDGIHKKPPEHIWNRSGTRPSMALEGPNFPAELWLVDTDITAHADWASFLMAVKGESLLIKWEEAYSIGQGGIQTTTYDRLPPGDYRLEVEELDIYGNPQGVIKSLNLLVPRPLIQTWWFWLLCFGAIAAIVLLLLHSAVKRRVRRAVRHARILEKERLRIAMDLHDDIGTRLSQISLISSHARIGAARSESKEALQHITHLTGELANSLSETVWMLNPKNNDLESLIGFLCRIASDLCRVGKIRCRIDADPIDHDIAISREFRHHFVLCVKEALNNSLKHSQASEIKMTIKIDEKNMTVKVTDNGVGFTFDQSNPGNGLTSLKRRMSELNGSFRIEHPDSQGVEIILIAPLKQNTF